MLRRIRRNRMNQNRPKVVFQKVGGPFPAPRPTSNVTLPMINQGGPTMGGMPGYYNGDYMDRGLDDYNALHYYGLDGLDNIDF